MLNIAKNNRSANNNSVESTVQIVTPEMARHWRTTAHFERQRKISDQNIKRLANEMTAGRFTPGTQIYICILPDGTLVLVNGNHTLEAIALSGIPQLLTVTTKHVSDQNEAGLIYAVFDIQRTRSWRDSLRAVGTDENMPHASEVLSAIGIIEDGFAHTRAEVISRIDRINKLEEYSEAANMFAECIFNTPRETKKLIKRVAIIAVALETFRYQPSFAMEFWSKVANDDGLVKGDPEKALLTWLRNSIGAGGRSAQIEHSRAAASAWNAAFQGRQVVTVKPNAIKNFHLLGTPWSSGMVR